jgi:hypothetical protein
MLVYESAVTGRSGAVFLLHIRRPAGHRMGERSLTMIPQLKCPWLWVAAGAPLGVAALSAFLIYAGPRRVTKANFDKIHQGMELEQVEAILGERQPSGCNTTIVPPGKKIAIEKWLEGPDRITVFTEDDKVQAKEIQQATIWEWVRWLISTGKRGNKEGK